MVDLLGLSCNHGWDHEPCSSYFSEHTLNIGIHEKCQAAPIQLARFDWKVLLNGSIIVICHVHAESHGNLELLDHSRGVMDGINTVQISTFATSSRTAGLSSRVNLDNPERIVLVAVQDGLDGTKGDGLEPSKSGHHDVQSGLEGNTFDASARLHNMQNGERIAYITALEAA